jgi:hypothetical protein
MNILIDDLPTALVVEGRSYQIDTDYRAALRINLAVEDPEVAEYEKINILLDNVYLTIPRDAKAAIQAASVYLNGGIVSDNEEPHEPRLYSFSQDASLIFAAFRQTHGIDLQTATMHWWKFLALFADLGQDTTFCQLVGLRRRVKNGTASKEEQKSAREMGTMFEVPDIDTRTPEEKLKDAEFERILDEADKKRAEAQNGSGL